MIEYANLTRGVLCHAAPLHFSRIQSTSCEQKRWADVLYGAGPDLLMHIALGEDVLVHDFSEKERITRALWQGLPWIRFALEHAAGRIPSPAIVRNGCVVTPYFEAQWKALDRNAKAYARYFGKELGRHSRPVRLSGCVCRVTGEARAA